MAPPVISIVLSLLRARAPMLPPDRLKSISVGAYAESARALLRTKLNVTKRFADNSKVTDHHAIIPTEQYVNLGSLSSEERNIFDLIVKRFIAILSPSFTYEQTTVKISVKGEIFYAKGKIIKSKGWKAVYESMKDKYEDSDEEQDQSLPDIKKGESLKLDSASINNGKTKPPARSRSGETGKE